jgi:cobalt/nickel transport system permease protein
MHIPDGLMDPLIFAIGWIIAIIVIGISTKIINKRIDNKQIPLMGTLAAGIFVAQMLNFPIGGGTTGHLVGAALAAIFLGPLAGMVVITVILVIQCLMFGDGGITALGLNIFNMAIIGCILGWYVYKVFPEKYQTAGIFTAAWLAVFIGSLACAIELAVSYSISGGAYGIPASIAIPTMLGYHTLIGIGEAIITTGVVAFVSQISPDMLKLPKITLKDLGSKEVAVNA